MGNEKNISFLLIPKPHSLKKNEAIGLGAFNNNSIKLDCKYKTGSKLLTQPEGNQVHNKQFT